MKMKKVLGGSQKSWLWKSLENKNKKRAAALLLRSRNNESGDLKTKKDH
jgi:hypothetical protein